MHSSLHTSGLSRLVSPALQPARLLAAEVLDLLLARSRIDLPDPLIREAWLNKLEQPIARGEAIQFVMPAFPCKSANSVSKVLGSLPDAGEKLALDNLAKLCHKIQELHPAGAKVILAADGLVYNDLIGVSNKTVADFQKEIRALADPNSIQIISLVDLIGIADADRSREILVRNFAMSLEDLDFEIHSNPGTLEHYKGLVRFMQEELECVTGVSQRQLKLRAKMIARACLQRSRAFAKLVGHCHPEAFRLSIHPVASPDKFPIALINPSDRWATPWHNVLVEKADGTHQLMKRREAEAIGSALILRDGRPWMFSQRRC